MLEVEIASVLNHPHTSPEDKRFAILRAMAATYSFKTPSIALRPTCCITTSFRELANQLRPSAIAQPRARMIVSLFSGLNGPRAEFRKMDRADEGSSIHIIDRSVAGSPPARSPKSITAERRPSSISRLPGEDLRGSTPADQAMRAPTRRDPRGGVSNHGLLSQRAVGSARGHGDPDQRAECFARDCKEHLAAPADEAVEGNARV